MSTVAPVLDSDVLIDYLRGAGPGRALVAAMRERLAYRVTAVTALELALGASYAVDPAPVNALLAAPCLPLNRSSGLRAGVILRELREAGRPIEIRDAIQAAICIHEAAPLVTNNLRHFARVRDLDAISGEQALLRWGRPS
ncbi:MAG: type II toxin-antitoxin system VapC family toxin [Solirubrobacteraceae bacterium]